MGGTAIKLFPRPSRRSRAETNRQLTERQLTSRFHQGQHTKLSPRQTLPIDLLFANSSMRTPIVRAAETSRARFPFSPRMRKFLLLEGGMADPTSGSMTEKAYAPLFGCCWCSGATSNLIALVARREDTRTLVIKRLSCKMTHRINGHEEIVCVRRLRAVSP